MALNYSSLGKRIRYFRKKRGLSQMALAEEIDCATTFISYIENGQKRMSLNTLVAIANVLQVSADELLVDSLDYNFRVTNHEFSDLMADCTSAERKILFDIVAASKQSLRSSKAGYYRKR